MSTLLWWFVQNSLSVAMIIPLVLLACRIFRHRPAVQHVLWTIVLIKFVTPPMICWPWTVPLWDDNSPRFHIAAFPPSVATEQDDQSMTAAERLSRRFAHGDKHQLLGASEQEGWLHSDERRSDEVFRTPRRRWMSSAIDMLFAAWCAGVVIVAVGHVRRIARHRALVRCAHPAPPQLNVAISSAAAQMGVKAPPALVSARIASPFLWCMGTLRLVWPASLCHPGDLLRSHGIIVHELAHVRRRDHWSAWLAWVAGMAWWWNPLFWFVRRHMRESAEMACDALSIATSPDGRHEYAKLLLEHSANMRIVVPAPALPVRAASRHSFERRLSMILTDRVSGHVSWSGKLAAVALALLALPAWSLGQAPDEPTQAVDSQAAETSPADQATDAPDVAQEAEGSQDAGTLREIIALWLADPNSADAAGSSLFQSLGGQYTFDEAVFEELSRKREADQGVNDALAEELAVREQQLSELSKDLAEARAEMKAMRAEVARLKTRDKSDVDDQSRRTEQSVDDSENRLAGRSSADNQQLQLLRQKLDEAMVQIERLQTDLTNSRARLALLLAAEAGSQWLNQKQSDATQQPETPFRLGVETIEVPDGGTVLLDQSQRAQQLAARGIDRAEKMEKLFNSYIQDAITSARAAAEIAKDELQHAQKLFDKGFISKAQLEAIKMRLRAAEFRVEQLESILP